MLDLRWIRENREKVEQAISLKAEAGVDLPGLLEADEKWRRGLQKLEHLRSERNRVSAEIGLKRREGENADELIEQMQATAAEIKDLEQDVGRWEEKIQELLLLIPNIPHPDVPVGADEDENVEVRRWGTPTRFSFPHKAHWDLGTGLGILDFERAARVAGSRFTVFWAGGARLIRALTAFMIDMHTAEHGYEEVYPPVLVNRASLTGTGQLPKFADDVFHVERRDFFLIPTAEVPVTNLFRGEILAEDQLPIALTAYTPCFRSEAGAAGRDTRGLIRQHQFDKVELVRFTRPEDSYDELEQLVSHAEAVLQRLGLPYRVTLMCTGDLGFAAAKKYDLEVWMPSYDRYVEISSCSNFEAFQARRADLRYRRSDGKVAHMHTLNGSGLAIGRTLAALLENYQQEDGTVLIPEALQPYMGGQHKLEPKKEG